jgi:hypothetical protein
MNWTRVLAFLAIAFVMAAPARASLMGSTVNFAGNVNFEGQYTVGAGVERSLCFIASPDQSACWFSASYDWGGDYIATSIVNVLGEPPPVRVYPT